MMKKSLINLRHPSAPQNVRVKSVKDVTDTTIELTWDAVKNVEKYNVYVDDVLKKSTTQTSIVIDNLETITTYNLTVSASNSVNEGAKSNVVVQKTIPSAPTVEPYYFGATYLNGAGVSSDTIVNCRIYKHGSTTAFATGTMTAGVLKAYLAGNVNIVAGELYDVCVLDKIGTATVEGMRTTFKVEIPQITLNEVTTSQKLVSGVTAKNIQVRISQNGTAKTIVWSDAETGVYSWSASPVVVGDIFKVETKVGNEYSSSQTTTARDAVGTVTPKSYTFGSSYVTGTFTGDVAIVALEVNGVVGTKVKVVDASNFQYYAKDKITAKTDVAFIIGYDVVNKQLDRKGVVIV
ncbi:fibronectin type III domain-containing protein [Listeria booriae]|uniref:fibronectin type III domain-containing protein n=1 Tax=Listeria booriae TaxID=1552123 RepID=UPI00162764D4|nr:fibronectin type III domain-containing protein [Listeria booriae]MBC1983010.1 fibronectin type III domain-containing protein [Listeria booriae]